MQRSKRLRLFLATVVFTLFFALAANVAYGDDWDMLNLTPTSAAIIFQSEYIVVGSDIVGYRLTAGRGDFIPIWRGGDRDGDAHGLLDISGLIPARPTANRFIEFVSRTGEVILLDGHANGIPGRPLAPAAGTFRFDLVTDDYEYVNYTINTSPPRRVPRPQPVWWDVSVDGPWSHLTPPVWWNVDDFGPFRGFYDESPVHEVRVGIGTWNAAWGPFDVYGAFGRPVQVRLAAVSGASFASAARNVPIPRRAAAPRPVFDQVQNEVRGVRNTMEFFVVRRSEFDAFYTDYGRVFTPPTNAYYWTSVSESALRGPIPGRLPANYRRNVLQRRYINAYTQGDPANNGDALVLFVRVSADPAPAVPATRSGRPASNIATVQVRPDRDDAPNVFICFDTERLIGVELPGVERRGMEISINGGLSWIALTNAVARVGSTVVYDDDGEPHTVDTYCIRARIRPNRPQPPAVNVLLVRYRRILPERGVLATTTGTLATRYTELYFPMRPDVPPVATGAQNRIAFSPAYESIVNVSTSLDWRYTPAFYPAQPGVLTAPVLSRTDNENNAWASIGTDDLSRTGRTLYEGVYTGRLYVESSTINNPNVNPAAAVAAITEAPIWRNGAWEFRISHTTSAALTIGIDADDNLYVLQADEDGEPIDEPIGYGGSFASLPSRVNVPARRAAPNATFNFANNDLRGINANMEWAVVFDATATSPGSLDVNWTPVTATTPIPRATLVASAPATIATTEPAVVFVRLRATGTPATVAPSFIRRVVIPEGPAPAPAAPYINFAEETVRGLAATMQFRWVNNNTTPATTTGWTNVSAGVATGGLRIPAARIPAAGSGNANAIEIRVRSTATAVYSLNRVLELPVRPATPSAVYDRSLEAITGVPATMEFRFGTGANVAWYQGGRALLAGGRFGLPGALPVLPANSVCVRQNSPSLALRNGTWQVRVRAVEPAEPVAATATAPAIPAVYGSFASAIQSIPVAARRGQPPGSFNAVNDRIQGLPAAGDLFFTTSAAIGTVPTPTSTWTPVPADRFITREVTGLTGSGAVFVRIGATAELAASNARGIAFPAQPGVPAATLNFATERLDNVNNTMEYRVGATGAWIRVPNNNIVEVTPGAAPSTIYVRTRAVGAVPASPAVPIAVPARLPAPTAAQVNFTSTTPAAIIGVINVPTGNAHEIRIGTAPWVTITGLSHDVPENTASVEVRLRATGSNFASAAITVLTPTVAGFSIEYEDPAAVRLPDIYVAGYAVVTEEESDYVTDVYYVEDAEYADVTEYADVADEEDVADDAYAVENDVDDVPDAYAVENDEDDIPDDYTA